MGATATTAAAERVGQSTYQRVRSTCSVRALEFYCGIGGLHYSLLRARPNAEVVGAFDINPHSNDVYEHNFGRRPTQKNLFGARGLPSHLFDKLDASLWLMSPPCQPFTRQGHQKDTADGRSQSFLRLLDLIPSLKRPPTHVLVENVVGFETSEMRDVLRETLRGLGFTIREHILSPRQFGVPYSRPRYFLLAKREPLTWCDDAGDQLLEGKGEARRRKDHDDEPKRYPPPSRLSSPSEWVPTQGLGLMARVDPVEVTTVRVKPPPGGVGVLEARAAAAKEKEKENDNDNDEDRKGDMYDVAPLRSFMEHPDGGDDTTWREYGVPQAEVSKALASIDVVRPASLKCNCFTKSYGKYVKGTGSFVASRDIVKGEWDGTVVTPGSGSGEKAGDANEESVMLRYFTEREVANIHSFPPEFSFPAHIKRTQRYALLGNSLSVACVAPLVDYLLNDARSDEASASPSLGG